MLRSLIVAAIVMSLFGMVPTALADEVTWTLTGLAFSDGGTATGSFVYDASTNTVTSIDIVTSGGTAFTGAAYTTVDPGFGPFAFDIAVVTGPSAANDFGANYVGTSVLEMEFFTDPSEATFESLTNAGGTVVADLNEFVCGTANCGPPPGVDLRGTVSGGTVVGVVAPEPSVLCLLGIGLLGMAGVTRFRTLFAQS